MQKAVAPKTTTTGNDLTWKKSKNDRKERRERWWLLVGSG